MRRSSPRRQHRRPTKEWDGGKEELRRRWSWRKESASHLLVSSLFLPVFCVVIYLRVCPLCILAYHDGPVIERRTVLLGVNLGKGGRPVLPPSLATVVICCIVNEPTR